MQATDNRQIQVRVLVEQPKQWSVGLLGDGRLPFKEEITGSKPVRSTKYTSVAQLEERHPTKVIVGGSSPSGSAKIRWVWHGCY